VKRSTLSGRPSSVAGLVLGLVTFVVAGVTAIRAQAPAPAASGPTADILFKPQATYRDQLSQADTDYQKQLQQLNEDYARGLEGLNTRLTRAGDLDGVLDVRREQRRFHGARNVAGNDVVLTPEPLAAMQLVYLTRRAKLERDRKVVEARIHMSYIDYLERLKQSMTQIGNIEAAVEVKRAQDAVKSRVDLTVLAPPRADRKEPATTAKREEPASVVLTQQTLKPPRGYIWVFATHNGFPAKRIRVLFEAKTSGRLTESVTDSSGKINFRIEEDSPYHLRVLSDGYSMQEVADASAGNSYWFKLASAPEGSGAVELKQDRWVSVPGVGRIGWRGTWSSSDNQRGPVLRSADSDVRFKGSNRDQGLDDSLHIWPDQTYYMVHRGDTYRIKLRVLGRSGRYLLEYQKQE